MGSNLAVSVLYSGTMFCGYGRAIEGYPSVGFSLADFSHNADFSHTVEYVQQIASEVLTKGIGKGVALNVNFHLKR